MYSKIAEVLNLITLKALLGAFDLCSHMVIEAARVLDGCADKLLLHSSHPIALVLVPLPAAPCAIE